MGVIGGRKRPYKAKHHYKIRSPHPKTMLHVRIETTSYEELIKLRERMNSRLSMNAWLTGILMEYLRKHEGLLKEVAEEDMEVKYRYLIPHIGKR